MSNKAIDPILEQLVKAEREKRQVRQIVDAEFARKRANELVLPVAHDLGDFLDVEDEPARYRVDQLWTVGGNVLLSAQAKAGKTNMFGNLIRSLADGDPFLDRFEVTPPEGRIVLLDTELDERMLRQWLRDQGIKKTSAVSVIPMKGMLHTLALDNPEVRANWAARLRSLECSVLLLDCLRPCLDALHLNEHTEAGVWLTHWDALKLEASIDETAISHHMGHTAARPRGDSRIGDWGDDLWTLLKETQRNGDDADPFDAPDNGGQRYFSALGRDVDLSKRLLEFDPATRRMKLTDIEPTRRGGDPAADLGVLKLVLQTHPNGLTKSAATAELTARGVAEKRARAAFETAIATGLVFVEKGAHNATVMLPGPSWKDSE
ncbi:AAA family ATPase [Mycolicibacterium sp. XJ879]